MNFKKKIVVTSVVSGVLPSAYLVSRYGAFENPEKSSSRIKVLGFILAILSYAGSIILANNLFLKSGIFDSNPVFAYGISFLLLIAAQALSSIAFIYTCEKIFGKAFFSSHKDISNRSAKNSFVALFILGLLITAFLFAFGPFFFIFISIYFIPNVYVHHKIKQIFPNRKEKANITIFFTLLVLMFPTALFLSGQIERNIVLLITKIGFYYAPLLLYLVMLFNAFDLFKFIKSKTKSGRSSKLVQGAYRKSVFLVILSLAVLIVLSGSINFNSPKISEYNVEVPRKSAGNDHLKIAMAADFHFSELTGTAFVENFIGKINELNADVVLFAGDIFESNRTNPRLEFIKQELTKIESKYGVYAAEGNHGYYRNTNSSEFFEQTGITLLKDTIISIDSSFQLMGRMDKHNRNRKTILELMQQSKPYLPLIALDHQPYYDEINFDGMDIYLSGHTHNGQLFPFNLIEKFIYELPWGYKKIDATHCFVTCGAQGWGPQVRTAGHSEIMLINVAFTGK